MLFPAAARRPRNRLSFMIFPFTNLSRPLVENGAQVGETTRTGTVEQEKVLMNDSRPSQSVETAVSYATSWVKETMKRIVLFAALSICTLPAEQFEYRVLATSKTSTMEKELNEAAESGYIFSAVMGGNTASAGSEVVVVMAKAPSGSPRRSYKLLATNKTSTMQKELQQMGEEGYDYKGQTVFNSTFGGREVSVIMERAEGASPTPIGFKLQATSRTSTLQKELNQAGQDGYEVVGLTVASTAFGGSELVSILRKKK
jgi:hypothetical protein